jgi:hypothetical protein
VLDGSASLSFLDPSDSGLRTARDLRFQRLSGEAIPVFAGTPIILLLVHSTGVQPMLGFFTDKKTKLEKKYNALMSESHRLSHTDRKASDLKMAEAEAVLEEIKRLENGSR